MVAAKVVALILTAAGGAAQCGVDAIDHQLAVVGLGEETDGASAFGLTAQTLLRERGNDDHRQVPALRQQAFLQLNGLRVGFSETSSFSAAFRRATGLTPTAYHRSLL
jgi:hypothetical protein